MPCVQDEAQAADARGLLVERTRLSFLQYVSKSHIPKTRQLMHKEDVAIY